MIESAYNIRKTIRVVWPNSVFLRTPDEYYYVPSVSEMDTVIAEFPIWNAPKWADCNWFALQAYAWVQYHRRDSDAPWSFGIADGNKFRKFPEQHTLNIAYCREYIYLIDVQNKQSWVGSGSDDYILTVSI